MSSNHFEACSFLALQSHRLSVGTNPESQISCTLNPIGDITGGVRHACWRPIMETDSRDKMPSRY